MTEFFEISISIVMFQNLNNKSIFVEKKCQILVVLPISSWTARDNIFPIAFVLFFDNPTTSRDYWNFDREVERKKNSGERLSSGRQKVQSRISGIVPSSRFFMTVPSFSDIGKNAWDIFKTGYHYGHGLFNISITNKSEKNLKLNSNYSLNCDSSKVKFYIFKQSKKIKK